MAQMTHFRPKYVITPTMALNLMQIEAIREKVENLHLSKEQLCYVRQKTVDDLCHYFRHLEELPPAIHKKELQGYLQALDTVSCWINDKKQITELRIKKLHGLLFSAPGIDPYRNGQNAVFNNAKLTKVLYLPPNAHQVPKLMHELVVWIARRRKLAPPIIAGIVHFGLNSIHPYYDGNGRTSRLLTRWILGLSGYDLGGLYCLERYYAKNLLHYYKALSLNGVQKYSLGRDKSDITMWLEYFLQGMLEAFQQSFRRIHKMEFV